MLFPMLFILSIFLPSKVLQYSSPHQLLLGKPPTLLNLRVFGCLCYATTFTQSRHKLDLRATKCCFLGFKHGTKGYLVLDLDSRNVFILRNVVFKEDFFSFCIREN
jgi:hypothetical protein